MRGIKKLRGKMVEHNISIEKLAFYLNISKATLYRKLKSNGESFTVKEINIMSKILKLTSNEIIAIFFSQ